MHLKSECICVHSYIYTTDIFIVFSIPFSLSCFFPPRNSAAITIEYCCMNDLSNSNSCQIFCPFACIAFYSTNHLTLCTMVPYSLLQHGRGSMGPSVPWHHHRYPTSTRWVRNKHIWEQVCQTLHGQTTSNEAKMEQCAHTFEKGGCTHP